MKRCPTFLMIKELPIKPKRCHLAPTNFQNQNGLIIPSFLWEMGTVVLKGVQIVLTSSESNLEIPCKREKKCISTTTSFISK